MRIFNYPFERNIPILESLYSNLFDEILFIQPFIQSKRENVATVYRAAFNFGGYFSDVYSRLRDLSADYYVFAGDDCILNSKRFGQAFSSTFRTGNGFSAFIPQLLPFTAGRIWGNPHKVATLGRFVGGYGLFDQRIEEWARFLPDQDILRTNLSRLNIQNALISTQTEEEKRKLTQAQHEVAKHLLRNKKADKAELPYPLTYAVSDFFVVSGRKLELFCHFVGLFASMNIFPAIAVPTAICCLEGRILQAKDLKLSYEWTFGRNQNADFFRPTKISELLSFCEQMEGNVLFNHPIKLSSITY